MHYGVSVVPARPYKPRDKAKVESGVLLAERWIIAALRNRKFFSIEELNQAIRELRDRINQRPFRKREGSRATQFAAVDKPAMGPLPVERSDLSEWSRARVNIDYHIAFDTNYYSVLTTWSKSWWKYARRRRPSRSSTRVSAWHRTYVRAATDMPRRLWSIAPVPTKCTWNGHRRGWGIGLRP